LLLQNSHGNWARNLHYLFLPKVVSIVTIRLGLFLFLFGLIFTKLEQFNSNNFNLTCSH
jgi:hypothetical protein